jgi:hypothetical protein
MADFGHDAHDHVARCPSSANPGSVYGRIEQFHVAQVEKRRVKVLQYLNSIPPEDAAQVGPCAFTALDLQNRIIVTASLLQVRSAIAADVADLGFRL